MPITSFTRANFAGQTSGTVLSSYVPQSSDLQATFTRLARSGSGSSLVFGSRTFVNNPTKLDAFYGAGPVLTDSQTDFDVTFILHVVGTPSSYVGVAAAGVSIGDSGSGNSFLDILTWQGAPVGGNAGFHVGFGGADIATPNYAMAADTIYTCVASIRLNSGRYYFTLTATPAGGSTTKLVDNLLLATTFTPIGRYVAIRQADSQTNQTDTTPTIHVGGIDIGAFTVSSALGAGTTSVVAGSGAGTANVSTTTATAGTAPYSYQFQRAPITGGTTGTFANIGTATTARTYADTGLAPGRYAYRVIVTDAAAGTATSNAAALTVAAPTFSVSTSPASLALAQGQSLAIDVTLAAVGGYTGTDTLSCTGLPAGVTASFNPATVANGAGASRLTLTAAGNAVTGAGEIVVQATDGSLTIGAPVLLQVNPPSGIVYPIVANILDTDLVTITRGGTTEQVAASVLKSYLA